MYWLEGDRLDLPKGEKLKLRYRVVVHEGDAKAARIADWFEDFARTGSAAKEE